MNSSNMMIIAGFIVSMITVIVVAVGGMYLADPEMVSMLLGNVDATDAMALFTIALLGLGFMWVSGRR